MQRPQVLLSQASCGFTLDLAPVVMGCFQSVDFKVHLWRKRLGSTGCLMVFSPHSYSITSKRKDVLFADFLPSRRWSQVAQALVHPQVCLRKKPHETNKHCKPCFVRCVDPSKTMQQPLNGLVTLFFWVHFQYLEPMNSHSRYL